MKKYLDQFPVGTVLTMQPIPDYSNPKRFHCEACHLTFDARSPVRRQIVKDYYRGEGISFKFEYFTRLKAPRFAKTELQ